jgi:hypothetical protein
MYDWTTDEDGYLIVIAPPDKTTTNAPKTSEAGTVATLPSYCLVFKFHQLKLGSVG